MKVLEYSFGGYKLRIRSVNSESQYCDIVLLGEEFPNKYVMLSCKIMRSKVNIIDLVGNGASSALQNRGYGTLLVNTLIAHLRDIDTDSDVLIQGRTSKVGDPINGVCYEFIRRKFWRSFGFTLVNADIASDASFSSRLKDLKISDTKLIGKNYKTAIDMKYFNLVDYSGIINHW